MNKSLPEGWKWFKMGEIFTIERGGSPRPIEDYITDQPDGINWIKIGDTKNITKYIYTTKQKIKPHGLKKSRMVYEGDFILSNSMSFGRPYIMKTSGCIHDGWLVIRKNPKIDNDFLYHALSSPVVYQQFTNLAKGSTVKNLNIEAVKQVKLGIPPLSIQHSIVYKLEEIFSEMDKGIENLKTAQQQLKIYRQSVLKWAFQGKLTNKYINDEEMPYGWEWIKNSELLKYVTSGSRDWKKFYSTTGSRFVRTQDINSNKLEIANSAYVDLPEKVEGKRSLIEEGDILMTITGANVGRVAVIDFPIKDSYVSQSVALLKYKDKRITKFLWYFFQAQGFGKSLIDQLVYGVGRPVLSLENMRDVEVLSIPLKDQQEIIDELENKFSFISKMEETIKQSLLQSNTLRQSILKKAFEGKLSVNAPF